MHDYADRCVHLIAFHRRVDPACQIEHRQVIDHRWVAVSELDHLPQPEANVPITAALMRQLGALEQLGN
jgi:hypothetical protein